ncbi:putative sodium-coupled neutral amino acid transporter 10 isoform X1 [Acipenser oxyrinchus oxyrinchus]|uniref:Sodium-coupled neutral amino acid transporter 10 isoform X1 n=1 Tax=Acipenser oxyrinchus oxyrinchus TaxID=40147 RepID=A0AAD8D684_ACIOX|nr:putative sodium-coupled neutral amino acid transporter 10 isoform X1 [Acipenser oxyrinchus oxyrinchus]
MAQTGLRKTVNFMNSIVGVSVLTLPYCFRQCGLVLGTLLLIFWSWLTYESSMMVVNTAMKTSKKTYCGLAQLSFGKMGKLTSEICILGFMMGVCTAFHVVMGDLAVHLLQGFIGEEVTQSQRVLLIFAIGWLVVLPLSLTLASDSILLSTTALVGFTCFMVVTLFHCCHRLLSSGQEVQVRFWISDGLLECLPIYGTAFSCHPQLLPMVCVKGLDVSEPHTTHAIKHAFAATLVFYTLVGSCGYVCFMDAVKGNILSNLPSSATMEGVRVVLLISVVMSIPSIIQPCRQAIGTLLFEQQVTGTFSVKGDMPLCQHVATTSILLFLTMTAGILVQDGETVLGVVGTTTGAIICYIFPSLMQSKLRKGTVSGKIVLTVGISLLITPVYANIARFSKEEIKLEPVQKVLSLFELKATTQPTLWTENTVRILMNEQTPNTALNEEKGTEYSTSDAGLEDDTHQKRTPQRNHSEINTSSENTLGPYPTPLRFLLKTPRNMSSFT